MTKKIIIGIDPGIAKVGVGIIENTGFKNSIIDYSMIKTPASLPIEDRLLEISKELSEKIRLFKPTCMAIEDLFFNKNVSSALLVGHARGSILLTAAQFNLKCYHYTPLQIKQAVCGYGYAKKHQVQFMVQKLLNLKSIPKPVDAADALAIAICHSQSIKLNSYA